MSETNRPSSSRWLAVCCYCLILTSFCSQAFSLDRYPLPYVDESFFYLPAINALEGQGLKYKARSDSPHGDLVWAHHAPFFPRFQVCVLWLFGASEFACRIGPCLAGHMAVALLCHFLFQIGLARAAVILAFAWLGDRSRYYVSFGRMEGVCLLCLSVGFIALAKALTSESARGISLACAVAGMLLGAAVGLHPVTLSFAVGACILTPLLLRQHKIIGLLSLAGGGLVPLAFVLLCWMPSPSFALEQFLWNRPPVENVPPPAVKGTFLSQSMELLTVLGPTKYWFLGLYLTVFLLLVPLTWLVVRGAVLEDARSRCTFLLSVAFSAFSLFGICSIVGNFVQPYYMVFFTIWPVVALAILTGGARLTRIPRLAYLGFCVVLCVCWLPSLRFNWQRFYESSAYYHNLDRNHVARDLAKVIPEGAAVTGDPEFTLVARKAGIHFTPLSWYPESTAVPGESYVLLSEDDVAGGFNRVHPKNIAARPALFEGSFAPGTTLRLQRYWVYGPMNPTPESCTVRRPQ